MAHLELSRFATVFIKEELQPRLDRGLERIRRMDDLSASLDEAEQKAALVQAERLQHGLEKGQRMLPGF